ncbi:MAG: FAD-dependent oxidoreductase [bacterium]
MHYKLSAEIQGDKKSLARGNMKKKIKKKQKKKRVLRKNRKSGVPKRKQAPDMVSLTIDGIPVTTKKSNSILEAAQEINIEIPTLCYHKALSPYGACRLCVVEIQKNGWKKIQTSCVYPVEEGIEVKTDTPVLQNIRKTIIQLLLARAPQSEKVQELAKRLGVQETPFVKRDEDCILCGLCIRMCRERMGRDVVSFKGRGDQREISPPFDVESPQCMVCGACLTVCPTASQRLQKMSNKEKKPLLDEFDTGLRSRSVIRIPFPQAVPNAAIIDREHCVHFATDKCRICEDLCEAKAINFDQKEELVEIPVGSIILSSGSEVIDGKQKREYGNGRYENIVTSIEFERILSASGPYHGHVVRPGDKKEPKRIAFIQCVGSRDEENPYCSSVCCMYATKEAVIAKEHSPGLECTIFFMDIRAFGKGFDEYYEKAQKSGVRYIRCRPSSIEEKQSTKNLIIRYADEQGQMWVDEYDMVVLACGLQPPKGMGKIAQTLGIEMNAAGFCKTRAFAPTDSSKEGLFVCGPCTEPKDIPETVTQSSSAAARSMELLAEQRHTLITKKEYPSELDVSGQEPRVGVFICRCGINIGAYVDVPKVVGYAKGLKYVVHVEENLYTCSQDSQKLIIEMIKEHKLNRVVVASCTPRTHEPLFRETIREAGLNPYLFEMANIRDQCSWIHMTEPEGATEKAKDLVKMAVAKAALLSPLKSVEIDVIQKALVIGAGVAGMVTSLSLARQGFEVFLVEKEKELGGNARHIFCTIEGNDVQTYLKSLIKQNHNNKLIHIYANAKITSVNGFIGNYETLISFANGREKKCKHGVIIVATGAQEYKPTEYMYGKDKRVITQRELEEQISNPKSQISNPKSVVMIQCVGSRDNGHAYCSRTCCSQAVKNALNLLELKPKAKIYVLYRDIRTYGFKENHYTAARSAGVMFVRYDKEKKPILVNDNGSLGVSVFDPVLQRKLEIHPDLVVLSTGIVPDKDNEKIAKMLKVPLNSDGYFLEAHVKLRPVDFATEGIFVAGLAHSPKFLTESIDQANAAAARAATILAENKYYAEATVSHVNDELCVGCGVCSNLCPYEAIEIVDEDGKRRSKVNEALCKGCGTCVAACPSGAMDQYGFTKDQILTMIKSIRE